MYRTSITPVACFFQTSLHVLTCCLSEVCVFLARPSYFSTPRTSLKASHTRFFYLSEAIGFNLLGVLLWFTDAISAAIILCFHYLCSKACFFIIPPTKSWLLLRLRYPVTTHRQTDTHNLIFQKLIYFSLLAVNT